MLGIPLTLLIIDFVHFKELLWDNNIKIEIGKNEPLKYKTSTLEDILY